MTQDPAAPSLWKSPLGRAVIVGGLALAIAFGFKVYTDGQKMDAEALRHTTKGELETFHDALLAHMKAQKLEPNDLPLSTPWYPGGVACGEVMFERVKPPEATEWSMVVPPGGWGAKKSSRYQTKFVRDDTHATWFARRDGDCDGVYETHTLRASLDWSAAFEKTFVQTQNLGE